MGRINHRTEGPRQWVTGLVVIAATIVGFFGFARLSREWTLGISAGILVALIIFFWFAGRSATRGPRR